MSASTPGGPDDPYASPAAPGSPVPPPPAAPPASPQPPSYGGNGGAGAQHQAYGSQPSAPARNGFGVAALVLGVVGILFAVLFFPLGFVLALAGIGLGIAGLRRASKGEATNRGMAITGIALSVIALLIAIALGALVGYIFNEARDCTDPELSQTEQQQCIEDRLSN